MGKSSASRGVNENGEVIIVHTEERYPYGTDILMNNGFLLILLNMVFGLLPTTLYGTRLTYLRCSVAQLYAAVFGLCMVILSGCFLPAVISLDMVTNKQTGTAVMLLIRVTHVGGFLLLLILGHGVAKKMPKIWTQLAKLVQLSIINLHGMKYHKIKRIAKFGRKSFIYYVFIMAIVELQVYFTQIGKVRLKFVEFFNIEIVGPMTDLQDIILTIGYVIWNFCSFSHVLVSMFVGYLVVSITVCLTATNEHLMTLFEDSSKPNHLLMRKRPLLKGDSQTLEIVPEDDKTMIEKLNTVKDIMVLVEDLTGKISSVMGISLITEVLILIANMLVNMFYLLVRLSNTGEEKGQPEDVIKSFARMDDPFGGNPPGEHGYDRDEEIWKLVTDAIVHSYFFYRLCCVTTEMINEAKQPLQVLKTVNYAKFSPKVQETIQNLKSDLSSSVVTLTATNYFQINKFLLTSVTSAVTTYIIVLIQFNAQEKATNAGNVTKKSFGGRYLRYRGAVNARTEF